MAGGVIARFGYAVVQGGRPVRKLLGCWAMVLAIPCTHTAYAQFWERLGNPTVTVPVEHPPSLNLHVDRIVFGPATGQCSEEIVHALVTDFVSHGLDVIDRENLRTILAEHDFALSGHVDQSTALEMGRMLGPSAMVVVSVQRCAAETNFSKEEVKRTVKNEDGTEEEVWETVYRLAAQGFLKLSVRTVDLTTGRIFAARDLAYASPQRTLTSKAGYPDEPSTLDLLDRAMFSAVREVRRMFLPWTEEIGVIFYDDKKCGLRNAYLTLRAGDLDRAHELSEANLATCKVTPRVKDKLLARAHYNVGILRVLRGEYDAALEFLLAAAELRPESAIVSEAIASARKAKGLAVAMQDLEEQVAVDLAHRDAQEDRRREEAQAKTLRNRDVMAMSKQGIPISVIVTKIRTSEHDFDTSTAGIIALVNAGVDEDVVNAMMVAE